MPNFNNVVLMGHLTRDIELRYTAGGTAVADLGLAVNNRIKKGDEWVDDPCFVDVTVWGKTAERCAEYLHKGSAAMVSGELRLDRWENEAGEKRSKHKVNANVVQFVGGKNGGTSAGSSQSGGGDLPF